MKTQKIQSVLFTGLLLSTLTLTIGCQNPQSSNNLQTKKSDSANQNNENSTDQSWTVQFPDPQDNGGDSIEVVTGDFLNQTLTGQLDKIEVSFKGEFLLVHVWDNEALSAGQPKTLSFSFEEGFTFVTVERQVTYVNSDAYLYLIQGQEIREGHYRFRLEFENFETNISGHGNLGLLGYVDLPICEVDRDRRDSSCQE